MLEILFPSTSAFCGFLSSRPLILRLRVYTLYAASLYVHELLLVACKDIVEGLGFFQFLGLFNLGVERFLGSLYSLVLGLLVGA